MTQFTDLHCHGGATFSFDDVFSEAKGVNHSFEEQLRDALGVHEAHGTTTHILSLITAPLDVMAQRIKRLATICANIPSVAGLHLEGPFISPLHKGAHDPNALINPTPESVSYLLNAGIVDGKQYIKFITIAPELPGGFDAVQQIAEAGVIPAVGHTDCDYEQALEAFRLGSKHVTHAFNAMRPIHHRMPGPVLAAIDAKRLLDIPVTIEAIADNVHLAPPILKMLFTLASNRICLVTDAMAAAGAPDGSYMLGSLPVTVNSGKAVLTGTDTIAGSTLFLDKAVEVCVQAGVSHELAIHAASTTPNNVLQNIS